MSQQIKLNDSLVLLNIASVEVGELPKTSALSGMLVETKCPAYNKISEKMSSQDDLTSWVLLSWAEIINRWLYKYMYKYYMQSARVVLLSGVQTFGCVPYFKNSYLRMKSANN